MRARGRGAVLVVSIGVSSAACVPWYRADEARALRADDATAMNRALAQCQAASKEAAPDCYASALERNPRDLRAALGLARAFNALARYAEARVVVERSLDTMAKRPGNSPGGGDADAARELIALFIDSYAKEELFGLALERSAALLAASSGDANAGEVSLEQAASQFPKVFGRLAEADALARGGKLREALDRYAEWLGDYGVPDRPMVQAWADGVLAACAPLTRDFALHGDDAARAERWVAALSSYSLATRYSTHDEVERAVADKLIDASSHVATPALLSPSARELATEGDELLRTKKVGAALRAYRRAVAVAPYWAEARHNLAVILASAEMYDSAADEMGWFLDLDPSSPIAEKGRALRADWAGRAKKEAR